MSSIITCKTTQELDNNYTDITGSELDTAGGLNTNGIVAFVVTTTNDASVKLLASMDGDTWFALLTYDMDGVINTDEIATTTNTPLYFTTATSWTTGFRYYKLSAKDNGTGATLTATGTAK